MNPETAPQMPVNPAESLPENQFEHQPNQPDNLDQNIDRIMNPDDDLSDRTVQGAAVPLTAEDIPRIQQERGTVVLQSDIDGMNQSRQ